MSKIILTGLSSGKTSVKRVIFDKIPPYDVELNKQTNNYYVNQIYSFGYYKLNIIEFPSLFSYEKNIKEVEKCLDKCNILIFIIDYKKYNLSTQDQLNYFKINILPILVSYKSIVLYIFIHNIDDYNSNNILQSQYNDEAKKIQSTINKIYSPLNTENIFITSIYNSTLYEAFSTILQNIIPQNQNLSFLTDEVCKSCFIESAYLFDIKNKFCLAHGNNDNAIKKKNMLNIFDICLNIIDFALEMGIIYEENENSNKINDKNISEIFDEDLDYSIEIKDFKRGLTDSKSIIFLKYIFRNFVLISIINKEKYESNHLIQHNINVYKEGVIRIFTK